MAFLFHKKEETIVSPSAHTNREEKKQIPVTQPVSVDVHTMPEKFFSSPGKQGSIKKHIITGVVLVIGLGGVMGVAAWLFLRSVAAPKNPAVEQRPTSSSANTVSETPQQPVVVPPPVTTPELPPSLIPTSTPEAATSTADGGESSEEETAEETPTTTETIITPEKTPSPPLPNLSALPSSRDSDGDGLTDLEEGLWGTDPLRPDTDADGYLDGNELLSLFDPARTGGARLESSPSVRTYLNPQLQYTVLVPVTWENRLLDPSQATQVIFTSATGEFVGISAQENYEGFQDPKEWYRYDYPSVSVTLLKDIQTASLSGIYSPDSLAAYFIDGGYLFAISYNPGIRETVNFQTTYRMMVQSFRTFVDPSSGVR